MENVKLIDASPKGTVTFEFLIDERYTNINGVMHGGAAGVIFDMCTTTALGPLARPGFWEWVSFLFIFKRFCSKVVIGNVTDEV
jgi:acyl-coenzyme A thioesterase 13